MLCGASDRPKYKALSNVDRFWRASIGVFQVDLTKEACHGSEPGMEAESEAISESAQAVSH
jgi:hypothetical protein